MCRKDDERVSVKQREFSALLAKINCKRCLPLAIGLSIVLPLWGTVARTTKIGMAGIGMMVALIIVEMIQLIALPILLYVVNKNETDMMPLTYRLYYLFSFVSYVAFAGMEYRQSGSLMVIAAVMTLYLLVPVVSRKEQKIMAFAAAIATIYMCIMASANGARAVVDVALIMLASAFFGGNVHEKSRQFERNRSELKEKTVSSEHDALTGLTNRRGLARRANVLWPYCARNHSSLGIIAIDIDYFKKYNDKFGHPEGDRCLCKIAGAIKESARRGTDVTARTGGEEFLVFVQDMDEEEIIELALKIRRNIAELEIPHAYVGVSKYVTVSMGISVTSPSLVNNFQKLYEEADDALYTAKENGRNCVVFNNRVYGRMKNALGTVINE